MGDSGLVIAIIVVVLLGTGLAWAVQKYGWPMVRSRVLSLPSYVVARARAVAMWGWNMGVSRLSHYQLVDFDGRIRLPTYGFGRKRGGTGVDAARFVRYVDPVHHFSFVYPDNWIVMRATSPAASIVVQLTCDDGGGGGGASTLGGGGGGDDSYKRFSVAWDDVSWSATTAESFGRAVAAQLPSLVPGSQLLSHGPYTPGSGGALPALLPAAAGGGGTPDRGSDAHAAARTSSPPLDAYQLVYRISDPVDASVLQLLNVVFISTHGGRRRAYTVTFGCDAEAYPDALRLARHMIDSFGFDDGNLAGGGGAGGAGGGVTTAAGGAPSASVNSRSSAASSADGDEVHVNVWERDKSPHPPGTGPASTSADGASAAALALQRAASPEAPVVDTPPNPAEVTWAPASLPQAGLAYVVPSSWLRSGVGSDDAPPPHHSRAHLQQARPSGGGSSSGTVGQYAPPTAAAPPLPWALPPPQPPPLNSVLARRWAAYASCDRREGCYKGLSLVCVDITPCLELLQGAAGSSGVPAAGGASLDPQRAAVLLQYLLYRYRCEVADNDALTQGVPPSGAALTPADEPLRPWLDALGQRWPLPVRLSNPVTQQHAAASGLRRGSSFDGLHAQPHGGHHGHGHGGASTSPATKGGASALLFGSPSTSTASRSVSFSAVGGGGFATSSSSAGSGGGFSAADLLAAPHQTAVSDVRNVASSRLLKVHGWLRTSGPPSATVTGPGNSGTASPSSMSRGSHESPSSATGGGGTWNRRYSAYSAVSMENDAASTSAEGQLVATTSAVLLGIHEAMVPVGAPPAATPGGGQQMQPLRRRVFGHIVTFSTSTESFARYEPLAKHVFQSLEAVVA